MFIRAAGYLTLGFMGLVVAIGLFSGFVVAIVTNSPPHPRLDPIASSLPLIMILYASACAIIIGIKEILNEHGGKNTQETGKGRDEMKKAEG